MSPADFFSKSTFSKYSFRNTIRVINSFRPNVLSGLICVQTICKAYQQTTIVVKELSYEISSKRNFTCKSCITSGPERTASLNFFFKVPSLYILKTNNDGRFLVWDIVHPTIVFIDSLAFYCRLLIFFKINFFEIFF